MRRLISLLTCLLVAAPAGATISFVAASTTPAPSSSGVSSVTIDAPPGIAANDLLLVQLSIRGGSGESVTAVPAGWTLVVRTNNGTNLAQAVYRKVATGSEPSSYTWTFNPSDRAALDLVAFRGVDTTTPVAASAGQSNASSSSITAPSVTTTAANSAVVRFFSTATGNATITAPGGTSGLYPTIATGAGPNGTSIVAAWSTQAAIGATGTAAATADSSAANLGTTLALTPGISNLAGFRIAYASTGLYCLDQTVTITTVDSLGNAVTGYSGTANLTTTTGKGTWLLSSGGGTLTDAVPDDGAAAYAWNSAQSSATFLLRYRSGAATVAVDATDSGSPSITDDNTQGTITFAPSGFTVTSAPFSNPAGGVPAFASPQAAGAAFPVYLTAYGQNPVDATCGIITSYAGAKNLKFWSTWVNPATGTLQATINGTAIATAEGASGAQSVTFTSGQATVTALYRDAGSVALSMKDDTTGNPALPTGIRGSTGTFVSRPANFVVTNVKRTSDNFANPAASTATGTVFIAAGRPFTATVTAVDASGNVTPNFGRESPAESVGFAVALVLPASGHAPAVSGTAGAFTNGVATGTGFAWPEAGIVHLVPQVADGDYLGAGAVAGAQTGNVGRFIPDSFGVALNTPVLGTACTAGGYSYVGQPLTYTVAPVLTATALAYGGATTQNYTGSLFRLTNASLTGRTYAAASGTLDTSGLPATTADPAIVDAGGGVATLTFSAGSGLAYNRGSATAPFNANITLALNLLDLDAVAGPNPVTFGGGTGIAFSAGAVQRYGRVALRNAVGSELLDLPMRLVAEYYLGAAQGFTTNTDDSCTTAPAIAFSAWQAQLAAGETCVRDAGAPGGSGAGCASPAAAGIRYRGTALAGDFNLNLAAPGTGNSGAVTVTGSAPAWLKYDWNTASPGLENPSGLATFGVFPGPASRIYQREVY